MNIQYRMAPVLTASFNEYSVPYGANFSWRIIFTFFADWRRTSKIKLREMLKKQHIDANGSVIRENCFRKIFENANPRKLCTPKICRYTVYQDSCSILSIQNILVLRVRVLVKIYNLHPFCTAQLHVSYWSVPNSTLSHIPVPVHCVLITFNTLQGFFKGGKGVCFPAFKLFAP